MKRINLYIDRHFTLTDTFKFFWLNDHRDLFHLFKKQSAITSPIFQLPHKLIQNLSYSSSIESNSKQYFNRD